MSSSSSFEEENKEEMIPMDIQIEIIKRLPIKSLIKFMSVSKPWKSVIQSSGFIADYHCSNPPRQFYVAWNDNNCSMDILSDDDKRFLRRLTLPITGSFELFGCSQGLFGFICDQVVVIWNPSIRKSVPIPLPDQRNLISPYTTDFGFTVCNATDPTVIMIGRRRRVGLWELKIYTLSTGDWRSVSDAPCESLDLRKMDFVMDGFIHWIAFDTNTTTLKKLILSFDIASEQFTELCLPPTLATFASPSSLKLAELGGSLVVLESREGIGVWVMEEKSFRYLYTVGTPPDTLKTLRFRKNGQLIISVNRCSCCHDGKGVHSYEEEVYSYDLNSKKYEKIKNSELSIAGPYMETLLLLDR